VDNQFTGTLPSELGSLTALTDLVRLATNQFTGSVPSELGSLTCIDPFGAWYSIRFTGSVPSELGSLTAVTDVLLDWTSFIRDSAVGTWSVDRIDVPPN
jgi:hypothetical protein